MIYNKAYVIYPVRIGRQIYRKPMSILTPEQQQIIQNCARDEGSYTQLVALFEHQNAQYRAVVDQQTELVCRYLPDTTLTFVNEAYCRFYNRSAAELIGQSYLIVLDESVRADVQRSLKGYLSSPDIRIYENLTRRYDGEERWIQWVRSPILNSRNELTEVQSVGRDMTDLKQTEQALTRSESRYRRLIEATPDGVMITSEAVVRYANPALVRMLGGKTPQEVVGKTVFDLLHPDYHDLVHDRIDAMGHYHEDASRRRERYVRLDGTPVNVEVSITPIELDEQSASLIFLHDITQRVAMEEELRQFQDQLRTLHRLSIDLSKASTFDEFCRTAVEEGRKRLGVDRLSLWFLNDARTHIIGSYGTRETGETIDERNAIHPTDEHFAGSSFDENHYLAYSTNMNLHDHQGRLQGTGWNALTALWDGNEVIGFLSADNLIHHQPTSPNELELLVLYGATLGHLASRIRVEEALRASEEAERRFQQQMRVLHEVNIELTTAASFDELTQRAVELGHSRLGFDRLSLWFIDEQDSRLMHGSYGIDESGSVRDERHESFNLPRNEYMSEAIDGKRLVWINEETILYDQRSHPVGKGWQAGAALMDRNRVIGCLLVDNLFNQGTPDRYTLELLRLYGAALGHLAARRWAEDALRATEESERHFQQQLRALHEVNMQLTQTGSFDDLCRRAVELAHTHLGFDRIGLWFTDPEDPFKMRGSFGIDEHGNLRDERRSYHHIPDLLGTLTEEIIRGKRAVGIIENANLYDNQHQVVGNGWLAAAALLDGEQVIGCLSVDNLVNHKPPGRYTVELLRLYGAALGHLAARRWVEEAMLQSEKRYRAIFAGAGVGICIVDGQGYPVSSNPAFQELLGYTDDELREIPFFTFTHPDDRLENHDLFGRLLDGTLPRYRHEKRYLLRNGQTHWVRTHVSQFPVSDGDEPLIIAVVEDIHEQKLAEANLRESEARNRVLREAIPDLMFLYDTEGHFVDYHSPTDAGLLVPPDQFLNRLMEEVLPIELSTLTRPYFEGALKSGKNQIFEYTLPVKDEMRYFESRLIPYSEGVLSIIRDITERRQMESNNLELGLQRERIRLISDFIRDASHQFRTPLSVINSKVYLIGKINTTEGRDMQLRGIQEQSDNILKLVESLVAMSRLDSDTALNPLPLQMSQLLQALYTRHETPVHEKEIQLQLEANSPLPTVNADVDELYNAFSHLLENAISYTGEGGCIVIRARAVGEAQIAVEIEDNGRGIEATELPYIFDRFFRGQIAFSTPGFGLGLAMVKKIVERHGGYIEVKSEPGKGTTFTVLLPAYYPKAAVVR
jgi:PAS domain S-box-containing protein